MKQSQAFQLAVTASLAVFGSLARLLGKKDKKAVNLMNICAGSFVAAFSGVLAFFVSDYFDFKASLAYMLAGICGWIGPQILDMFASLAMQKIGLKPDSPAEEAQTEEDESTRGA